MIAETVTAITVYISNVAHSAQAAGVGVLDHAALIGKAVIGA